jgi:predicted TIM-barrel fold metal-dependent hydrolase
MTTTSREFQRLAKDEHEAKRYEKYGHIKTVTFIDEPEPEELFCPIVSADDHALEPPSVFQDRLPSKLRDRAPQLIADDEGIPWWHIDDDRVMITMNNGAVGRIRSEWCNTATTYDEFRPAVFDSRQRLHDMDQGGIWASLCFASSVWGFAGTRFSRMKDAEAGFASFRAYNDWMIDEWCAAAPDRYIPCQITWLRDPEIAAEEVRRNADRGFRALSFSENPEGIGFPNIYSTKWDPLFRACEETDTVINLHVGSSGGVRRPCSDSHEFTLVALFPLSGIEALVDWIFAQIPLRFPNLKIVLSEGGASWVPMAMERLSRAERHTGSVGKEWPKDAPSPRDLVHRNFYFTSIEDPMAFKVLDIVGADNVMVETDYPHYDSTWPESQAMIRSELEWMAPDLVRKVCFENACRVYRHPLPPDSMIAASSIGLAAAKS